MFLHRQGRYDYLRNDCRSANIRYSAVRRQVDWLHLRPSRTQHTVINPRQACKPVVARAHFQRNCSGKGLDLPSLIWAGSFRFKQSQEQTLCFRFGIQNSGRISRLHLLSTCRRNRLYEIVSCKLVQMNSWRGMSTAGKFRANLAPSELTQHPDVERHGNCACLRWI